MICREMLVVHVAGYSLDEKSVSLAFLTCLPKRHVLNNSLVYFMNM